jgi:hypothetical protein
MRVHGGMQVKKEDRVRRKVGRFKSREVNKSEQLSQWSLLAREKEGTWERHRTMQCSATRSCFTLNMTTPSLSFIA